MYKDQENNGKNNKDAKELERIRKIITYELEDIKEELMEELADQHEDFKEEVEDLKDAKEEIKQELIEELQDLEDERRYLLREIGETANDIEDLGENAKEQIERAKENLEKIRNKKEKQKEKYLNKIQKKLDKVQKKAAKRINISVDEDTSDEWRDWSEELGSSVSELIRKSMRFVKNNIGDLSKLEEMGESIERAVKESGIEDLGEKIEREFKGKKFKPKIKINLATSDDKDRIKKRVRGLIKLQKSLPIDKLAQALNRANEDAENLIYELVDEGIEGTIEDGVFKFTSSPEEVISKINNLIDEM
jgi:DNA repair exonuclease SbcCD ATPase subunit